MTSDNISHEKRYKILLQMAKNRIKCKSILPEDIAQEAALYLIKHGKMDHECTEEEFRKLAYFAVFNPFREAYKYLKNFTTLNENEIPDVQTDLDVENPEIAAKAHKVLKIGTQREVTSMVRSTLGVNEVARYEAVRPGITAEAKRQDREVKRNGGLEPDSLRAAKKRFRIKASFGIILMLTAFWILIFLVNQPRNLTSNTRCVFLTEDTQAKGSELNSQLCNAFSKHISGENQNKGPMKTERQLAFSNYKVIVNTPSKGPKLNSQLCNAFSKHISGENQNKGPMKTESQLAFSNYKVIVNTPSKGPKLNSQLCNAFSKTQNKGPMKFKSQLC